MKKLKDPNAKIYGERYPAGKLDKIKETLIGKLDEIDRYIYMAEHHPDVVQTHDMRWSPMPGVDIDTSKLELNREKIRQAINADADKLSKFVIGMQVFQIVAITYAAVHQFKAL